MSKEQFKVLFDTHFDAIRRYLYYRCADSELASDLAQDLFTRLWEKQMNLDPVRDRALLYKIASDLMVSKFRRRRLELNFSSSVTISGEIADTDKNVEYSELSETKTASMERGWVHEQLHLQRAARNNSMQSRVFSYHTSYFSDWR